MPNALIIAIAWLAALPALASDVPIRFGVGFVSTPWVADALPTGCATFEGRPLQSGQRLHFLSLDKGQWLNGIVVGTRSTPCGVDTPEDGAYDIQLEPGPGVRVRMELSLAVIATEGSPMVKEGKPLFVGPGDGQVISFHRCASREGIHFFAWAGDVRLWHEYYYLGYDVDPTCSEDLFRGMD